MTEIETLSEDAIVLLVGLRDASLRRREPTPACPSGLHTRFTVTDLVTGGLLLGGDVGNSRVVADLDKAGRGLYKKHLVTRHVMHTRAYYGLTAEGLSLVYRIEAEADVTDLVAAEHAREAAAADLADAERRVREAAEALRRARKARAARYPLAALLEYRREFPLSRR